MTWQCSNFSTIYCGIKNLNVGMLVFQYLLEIVGVSVSWFWPGGQDTLFPRHHILPRQIAIYPKRKNPQTHSLRNDGLSCRLVKVHDCITSGVNLGRFWLQTMKLSFTMTYTLLYYITSPYLYLELPFYAEYFSQEL